MRIALIADIHGNLAALDAAFTEIERAGVDQVVCLGDVAATGPQPHEVVAELRHRGCPVVMGNADAELLASDAGPGPDPATEEGKLAELARWGAARLDADDLAFIRSFPPTISIVIEPFAELLCVHGSPRDFNDVIRATTPAAALDPMLMLDPERCPAVIAGGHTHVPLLRPYRGTILANPGSVGSPHEEWPDGRTIVAAYASFAILSITPGHQSLAFHRVPYDQSVTIRAMDEQGMPFADWVASDWQWTLEQP
ncbi:MAG: metallophosphoesterase family protein [Chloroflexia bacterium]|nr:metallophosphoesterase family protein [Chloroflexia bacterium]